MISSTLQKLAPYRNGQELLEARVRDINYILTQVENGEEPEKQKGIDEVCRLHSVGEFQDLLFDLGYSSKEVQSKYYNDGKALIYTRENEIKNDVLVEGRTVLDVDGKFWSAFPNVFYANVSKKEQTTLENSLPHVLKGSNQNKKNQLNNILSLDSIGFGGATFFAFYSGDLIIAAGIGIIAVFSGYVSRKFNNGTYSLQNNSGQHIHQATKKIEKLNLKYSTQALQAAFQLPRE